MAKLFILIAIMYFGSVSAYSNYGVVFRPSVDNDRLADSSKHNDTKSLASTLCSNTTLAQSFVNELLTNIATLMSNASCTGFLQVHAQVIAYLQNNSSYTLLETNCTAYFDGLQVAREGDRNAQRQMEQCLKNVKEAFEDMLENSIDRPQHHCGFELHNKQQPYNGEQADKPRRPFDGQQKPYNRPLPNKNEQVHYQQQSNSEQQFYNKQKPTKGQKPESGQQSYNGTKIQQ